MTATNPGGSSPDAQPPSDAVDNDLGFLDECTPTCCTYLEAPCTAHSNIHISDCGCTTEEGDGPACTCSHGSKWLDANMANSNSGPEEQPTYSSTLVLSFAEPQTATAYELITADDNDKRDPTSWTFYAKLDDMWVPYKVEEVQAPPRVRYTSYGVSSIPTSPLPEGSHAVADPSLVQFPPLPPPAPFDLEGFQSPRPSAAVSPLAVALASSLSTAILVVLAIYCYWTRRVRPMIRMYNTPREIEQMEPMRMPLRDALTTAPVNDGAMEFATAADEQVSAEPARAKRDETGRFTSL